jgi:hypothetical protein
LRKPPSDRRAGHRRQVLLDLAGAESADADAHEVGLAAHDGEQLGRELPPLAAGIGVPVRAEDEQRRPGAHARDVAQQPERVAVSPMEVVQHEQHRRLLRDPPQEPRDGVVEPEARIARRQRRRRRRARQRRAQPGDELGKRRGRRTEQPREPRGIGARCVGAQRLDPRRIRWLPAALEARAREHDRPSLPCERSERASDRRLADPGLPREHDDAPPARERVAELRPEPLQYALAADEHL